MTLTTVIGSSGSGKTTFLNDVHRSHKCTYIRQYHNIRPYIIVSRIPYFDPSRLPYWHIYENEGKADTIKVGGTMAGVFTAGLSGGQRKLLLFELLCQRVAGQQELLIVLDEPFAGVTDDFIPFIVDRLDEMRKNHNILLVTNDHVETLTNMADNTITVSAIDRSTVEINNRKKVNREKAIAALSMGDSYEYDGSIGDNLKFFLDVEVLNNMDLLTIVVFIIFSFGFYTLTFWNSAEQSAALVLIAGSLVAFFCVYPYVLSLVEWRIAMQEEAEALLHSSKGMTKFLKCSLTVLVMFIISWIEYGLTSLCVDGLEDIKFWIGMVFDSISLTFSFIALGIYTDLPFQAVQIIGSLPFLFVVFFSTTFSPGAGVEGLKSLRYLFSRFYFWCIVPGIAPLMEGCPAEENEIMLYLMLSAFLPTLVFISVRISLKMREKNNFKKVVARMSNMWDDEFAELQVELYGETVLKRMNSSESATVISKPSICRDEEEKSAQSSPHHVDEEIGRMPWIRRHRRKSSKRLMEL